MIEFYETTFDFENKKSTDLEAILFGFEACRPSYGYGPTLRPYHLFHFIASGCGSLQVDGTTLAVGPGDAFLIPAEKLAYYEASAYSPWTYYWVGITGFRADEYVRQIQTFCPERYVLRRLTIEKYIALIKDMASQTSTNAETYFRSKAALYGILSALSADLSHGLRFPESSSLAARIKFYLDTKYTEKLKMEALAAVFGIHPNHLSRVFTEAYGIPPKQYLLTLKMKKASQLLATSDMPVALIAESLGYEDQHVFSRAFKNYWGQSPLLHKKKALPRSAEQDLV